MNDGSQLIPPPQSFLDACEELGIAFDDGDIDRLGRFLGLLLEANQRFNLTRITDPVDAWHRHVYDSLTLLPIIASVGARRLIDIGSGGGLPGLVLAIVMPDVHITLVESTGKKARFLRDATTTLGLDNVEILDDRAEAIGRDRQTHRERYDVVTARAVGKLPVLIELTVPLARIGGLVLAIKGRSAGEEVVAAREALHALHSHVIETRRTPTGTIVIIEKQRRSPKAYPRQPGEPNRAPIGGKAAKQTASGVSATEDDQ
jgi:16S rRNA (guanine527-N7)-methyltransferase